MRKRKKKNLSNDDRSIFFSFRLYILYLIVLLYFRSLCTRDEKRKKKTKRRTRLRSANILGIQLKNNSPLIDFFFLFSLEIEANLQFAATNS